MLAGAPAPASSTKPFENPSPGHCVLAAELLTHLDLDSPGIRQVLKEAYPYLDHNPGLKEEVHARVRAWAWMTLKGFNRLAPAHRALRQDLDAQRLLGFHDRFPCYDTFRELFHERLKGIVHERLLDALLVEQRRILPTLGDVQVEDATPLEARRREQEAPFNPHYETRMMKGELRWDPVHEALLVDHGFDGLAHEGHELTPLTQRLGRLGFTRGDLTVDGAYTSFQNIAYQWRAGVRLRYRAQEPWKVDAPAALEDVLRRYQAHREDPAFLADAPLDAKLRFLVDHGSPHDVDAVGRYLRDTNLTTSTPTDEALVSKRRNENEGLNAELKRLPLAPARCGTRELLRREQACALALHLVQLTRLQHGVTTGLCRVSYIL